MSGRRSDLLRALFAAYLANDRKAVEDALTEDFRFTSPYDDAIDKTTYFAKILYKARARIEQGFGRLKRFKRVALRCEKTARNFRSIVSFAAGLCLIEFVHTA